MAGTGWWRVCRPGIHGGLQARFYAPLAHDECYGNEPKQEDVDARSCLGRFWALYSTVADEGRAMDWP